MSDERDGAADAMPFDAVITDIIGDDATSFDAVITDVIPALAARLRASGLGELEVRTADWRVRVRRDAQVDVPAPHSAPARPGLHLRGGAAAITRGCLLYTSPSPRD